jgi:ribosomal subunit interface protein
MLLEPSINFLNFPHSPVLEEHVSEKINKLNQFYQNIMHCDVALILTQNKKHQGKLYNVRIKLTVPGEELSVTKPTDEDVYVAVRDAFQVITRRLREYSARRRQNVKLHPRFHHGVIARIFPEEGYGFIDSNGSEYYFSVTNVAYPDFARLNSGMEVQFLESWGDDGRQANRVTAGKHHALQK